jgi:hypothetical protein
MAALAVVAALGVLWPPLLLAAGLPAVAAGAALVDAARGATRAAFPAAPGAGATTVLRVVTGALYVLQPLARLRGRMRRGLTPWRTDGSRGVSLPRPRTAVLWDERWQSAEERLRGVEAALTDAGAVTRRGGDFDRWDLEVRGGALGAARVRMAVEEHGAGRQLVRLRAWPRPSAAAAGLVLAPAALAGGAALSGAPSAAAVLGALAAVLCGRAVFDCGVAQATVGRAAPDRSRGRPVRRGALARAPVTAALVAIGRARSAAAALLVGALAAYGVATAPTAPRPPGGAPAPPRPAAARGAPAVAVAGAAARPGGAARPRVGPGAARRTVAGQHAGAHRRARRHGRRPVARAPARPRGRTGRHADRPTPAAAAPTGVAPAPPPAARADR